MWIASDKDNKLMLFDCDEKPRHICNVSWTCDNHRGVGYLTNTDIDISWKDKLDYDIWYVNHVSLWLDLKIIFMTIKNVIKREDVILSNVPFENENV